MRMLTPSSVDLSEIAENLNGKLYKNYVASRCPFHDDSKPSFFVYPDFYYCKSCGARGKTIHLLEKTNQYGYVQEKPKFSRNPFTKWLQERSLLETLKFAYSTLQQYPAQGYYLQQRGLTAEVIKRLKLGWLDGYYLFPIFNQNGKLAGAVSRSGTDVSETRYFVPNQQEDLLYCPDWNLAQNSGKIFLVFGIFDSISLYQLNRPAISTTRGTTADRRLFENIRKRIVIIPDKDELKQGLTLASRLGWRGVCKRLDYPVGKDINDLFVNGYVSQLKGI